MAELQKVRVQLLNGDTGEVIEEVNVLTSPDAVLFSDGKNLTEKLNEIELTPGPKGDTGAQGPQGIQGPKGDTGAQGPIGPKGEQGAPFKIVKIYRSVTEMNADYSNADISIGSFVIINTDNVNDGDNAKLFCKSNSEYTFITDLSGAQGIQGPKGDTGPQGIQGPKGDIGAQGPQGLKGDTGPQGARGTTGATGAKGDAATIALGTVSTGAAGSSASVTNSGTTSAAIFNFTIPRGATGATGPQGPKGDTGATGARGATGATGPQGPKGDKGESGDKIKVGSSYSTASEVSLFLKKV